MGLLSGVFGSVFGSKPKPINNPTQYDTLPDFGKDMLTQLLARGQQVANNTDYFSPIPYSTNQMAAISQLESGTPATGMGFNFGQKADNAFARSNNMYTKANQYLSGALPYLQEASTNINRGVNPITGQEIQGSISDFMNPYTDSVVNNTVRDIEKYGRGLFSDARGLISDAGGTGSNRERLVMADIADNMMRAVGDQSAALRQSGFESAASRALSRLQGERSNYLAGAGMNINQAGQMGSLGATQGSLASGMTALGNSYLQGRGMMQDIATQNAQNTRTDLQGRIDAGNLLREQRQQAQGVPLEQLQLLSKLFGLIPVGGGNVAFMRENPGALGRVASTANDLGSAWSKFMGRGSA